MNTATLAPATATATATRTSARLDLYAPIHKALRSFMMDTLARIGRLDVDDSAEMPATLGQFDALLQLCESHLRHENEFVHPAIEAREGGRSRRIAGEHREHLAHIGALRDEAAGLRQATDEARRTLLAQRLYRHLALFVADNFQHMHLEETAHNASLWAHYSDAELSALHDRLLASVPPAEMMLVARWMIPALNPAERAGLVKGLQAGMPPEALAGLLAQVRPHLDDRGWDKLARAIGVPQQPGLVHVA